jgi:hypothetical protein
VSTLDQRVDRQLNGITVERTFTDTVSGKDTDRPQLEAMLGFVRGGDTVIVHSIDRLARNLEDLRTIVRELTAKDVRVQFLTEQLTFTGDDTAMATLLLSVMGAFAAFERALIRKRQREGIGGMVPVCTVVGLTRSRPHRVRPPGLPQEVPACPASRLAQVAAGSWAMRTLRPATRITAATTMVLAAKT